LFAGLVDLADVTAALKGFAEAGVLDAEELDLGAGGLGAAGQLRLARRSQMLQAARPPHPDTAGSVPKTEGHAVMLPPRPRFVHDATPAGFSSSM